MFDYIRQSPDWAMALIMLGMGMLSWIAIVYGCILWSKLKDGAVCKYIRIQQENVRLRRRIRKMQEEIIRGRAV